MSQSNVERIIGRLMTDEEFRGRFAADPRSALREAMGCGVDLTPLELQALVSLKPGLLERCAQAIDPRIQKANLHCKPDLKGKRP